VTGTRSPQARQKLAARLKVAGIAILLSGLVVAPIHYWRQTRVAEDNLGDLLPGYNKSMKREMRVQQGTFGIVLMQWSEALDRPITQVLLIVVGAGLLARFCYFAAARALDDEDEV
jgi:hypothetical protein